MTAEQRRQRLIAAGTAVVLGAFAYANRSDIPRAFDAATGAQTAFLAAGVVLAFGAMWNQAAFHAAAQRAAAQPVTATELVLPVAAAGFMNAVVKSGAMAGLAPMLSESRRQGRSRAATVAGYVLVNVLGHLAFAVTLTIGLVALFLDGRFTRVDAIAAVVFVVFTSVQMIVIGAAVRSREVLRRLYRLPDHVARRLRRQDPSTTNDRSREQADELFDSVQLLRDQPRLAAPAAFHALLVEAIGIGELWCVLRALHVSTTIGVALIAYAVSVLFTIVGFLPGGLGVVEFGLGALLLSFGITKPVTVAAVVLYRVVELWIPMIVGLFAARHLMKARQV